MCMGRTCMVIRGDKDHRRWKDQVGSFLINYSRKVLMVNDSKKSKAPKENVFRNASGFIYHIRNEYCLMVT